MRFGFSLLRRTLSSRRRAGSRISSPSFTKKSEMAYSSFTSIDWTRTKAYCSEVLAAPPSIYINLKGINRRASSNWQTMTR